MRLFRRSSVGGLVLVSAVEAKGESLGWVDSVAVSAGGELRRRQKGGNGSPFDDSAQEGGDKDAAPDAAPSDNSGGAKDSNTGSDAAPTDGTDSAKGSAPSSAPSSTVSSSSVAPTAAPSSTVGLVASLIGDVAPSVSLCPH